MEHPNIPPELQRRILSLLDRLIRITDRLNETSRKLDDMAKEIEIIKNDRIF